jgi:hypothetical protein
MRYLAAAMCLATAAIARSEPQPSVPSKLVAMIDQTCDFMAANPKAKGRVLAARLGGVIGESARGFHQTEYRVALREFPKWHVTVFRFTVTLVIPASTAITVADLEQYLGPSRPRDFDDMHSSQRQSASDLEDLQFEARPGRKLCWVYATSRRANQRVLSVNFQN